MKRKFIELLILILLPNISFAQVHLKNISTKANKFAWAKSFDQNEVGIWPYEIKSIGNSMQSFQQYDFSAPYWHDGLDMRADAGAKVYASVSGKVVNIENYYPGNKLYWEIAILDDNGFVWKYHHVDSKSIPEKIKIAFKKGSRITQGEYIGDIITWPETSYGERFHHIHMLVVNGEGQYINPFKLLPKLSDSTLPVISEIGLFDSRRNFIAGNSVKGEHGIYVNAFDTILHSRFNLTPYLIMYKLDGGEEKIVWKFDHLPSFNNDQNYIEDFYLKGTCGNYRCRNFYINLNFDPSAENNATKLFNLKPGEHEIEVSVSDFVGNQVSKIFNYKVE